jgi:hypothetical protein
MAESDTNEPGGISGSASSEPAARRARPALPPGAKPPPPPVVKPPEPIIEEPAAAVRIEPPSKSKKKSSAPIRPSAPLRPAVPPPIAVPQAPVEEEPEDQFVVEAEDSVIVPEMPLETLAHPVQHVARERTRYLRSIGVRRTFIPILLTLGVMLIAASTARYFVSEDAPLYVLPTWSPIVGYIVGGMLLIVAVFNILQVRSELARIGPR